MKTNLLSTIITCSALTLTLSASAQIKSGQAWNDTKGQFINAHGSSVIYDNGTYYWFGECRDGFHSQGISCYKSKDLQNWENLGLVLAMQGKPSADNNDISDGRLFERPSVVYNPKTRKWVMWIHWEVNSRDYGKARVAVAQSDKITGPYQFYKVFNPNFHDSRDQSLFADTDGKAYQFASVDMNTNTNISELRDDFLEPSGKETQILRGKKCEASAIFKVGKRYFGLFSGCTGWAPNPGRYAYSDNIMGEWTYKGDNFCIDAKKEISYDSQSACVFKVDGDDKKCVYVGDRWNSKSPGSSLQVWLPISMRSGFPAVRWYDEWTPTVFDKMYRYKRAAKIENGKEYAFLERRSDRLVSKSANHGLILDDDNDETNLNFQVETVDQGIEVSNGNNAVTDTPTHLYRFKEVKSGKYLDSTFGSLRLNEKSDEETQTWKLVPQDDGYYNVVNAKDGKYLSVSGAGTQTGSGIYLSNKSERIPQLFSLYFDSDKHQYEEADMFGK